MRVKVLGNIPNGLKHALAQELSKYNSKSELLERINKNISITPGLKVQCVKYNELFSRIFNTQCVIRVDQVKSDHNLNISLKGNKSIIKYTGSVYNILYNKIGYNKLCVESNLLFLKGSLFFYKLNNGNSFYGNQNLFKIFSVINNNLQRFFMYKYLLTSVSISKEKVSLSAEYILNRISKVSVELVRDKSCTVNSVDLVVNPVDNLYSRVLGSIGLYRESNNDTGVKSGINANFYGKGIFPIWDLKYFIKKEKITENYYHIWKYKLFSLLNLKNEKPTKNNGFLQNLLKNNLRFNFQCEADTELKYNTQLLKSSSKNKLLGIFNCSVNKYNVFIGGLLNNTYNYINTTGNTHKNEYSPVLGLSYTPKKNIFIENTSIYWTLCNKKEKSNILKKICTFEINITKEF
ncbi:hypothetical protein NEPAR04_2264 [Nematocida parisii]|nr:hypothetical protein NEPAR04_2264 [Nematocida parisii]